MNIRATKPVVELSVATTNLQCLDYTIARKEGLLCRRGPRRTGMRHQTSSIYSTKVTADHRTAHRACGRLS